MKRLVSSTRIGGEVLVPWNEPAEGAALIHLELLDGEFAIYEGDDEIAVCEGSICRSTTARSPSRMPASCMLSPDMRT